MASAHTRPGARVLEFLEPSYVNDRSWCWRSLVTGIGASSERCHEPGGERDVVVPLDALEEALETMYSS